MDSDSPLHPDINLVDHLVAQIYPFARLKSKQQYNLNPVNSPPSALSNKSSRGSLISTSSMPLTTSFSTSPDGAPTCVTSLIPEPCLNLPPPAMSLTSSSTGSVPDTIKSPTGLFRRLSRGAHNTISRRRTSNASAQAQRDQSAGPMVVRRRSDSNRALNESLAQDVSDLELESYDEISLADVPHGGPTPPSPCPQNLPSGQSLSSSPVLPVDLSNGTTMFKITKRKPKPILLKLNVEAGKLTWDTKQVYLDDIVMLRKGPEAKEYIEAAHQNHEIEDRWLSVFHLESSGRRDDTKRTDLISPNKKNRDAWVDWINTVQRLRIQTITDLAKGCEKTLADLWRREAKRYSPDEKVEKAMDFTSVKSLCQKLNIHCPDSILRANFILADVDRTGSLCYSHFKDLMRRLRARRDVKKIFEKLSKNESEINLDSFLQFLHLNQGIDVDAQRAGWILMFEQYCQKCRDPPDSKTKDDCESDLLKPCTMNFAAFQDLMLDPCVTEAIPSKRSSRTLDRPLNEYFISSSHNTYLSGKQFLDTSSTEMYVLALNQGCRSVEIDCWDGSDGKPIVKHGLNRTTSVSFAACINVINQHAFRFSEYPLVISLEVHCNPAQQTIMTEIMKSGFGDKLVTAFINPEAKVLPSPEALKRKILIKVKASTEELKRMIQNFEERSGSKTPMSSLSSVPIEIQPLARTQTFPRVNTPSDDNTMVNSWLASISNKDPTSCISTPLSPSSSAEESDYITEKGRKKLQTLIVPVLGDLGIYCKGVPFTDFRCPEARIFNHIYSFSETVFDKRRKANVDNKLLLERHNSKYLMRVYPKRTRMMSDNFNPLHYWRRGVQMCAMNIQTNDEGMKLNNAMFATGDDSEGYVLKPAELRPSESRPFVRPDKKRVRVSIDVISAQRLPGPKGVNPNIPVYPYVELEIHCPEQLERNDESESFVQGSPVQLSKKLGPAIVRTNIADNAYDPEFHDLLAATVTTRHPDLVFLKFKIYNSSEPHRHIPQRMLLAEYTAKLSSLQQGYRHIPLNDIRGARYYNSTLFCRIRKEPVTEVTLETADNPVSQLTTSISDTRLETRGFGLKRLVSRTPSKIKNKENHRDLQTGVSRGEFFPPGSSGPVPQNKSETTSFPCK